MPLELEECPRSELGDAHDHAARGSHPEVGPGDGLHVARPGHAARLDRGSNPLRLQLLGRDSFEAGRGDGEAGELVVRRGRKDRSVGFEVPKRMRKIT
jgi:hypothetical protein